MRIAAPIVIGLLASAPAFAGGVGVMGQVGAHTEKVYFYSSRTADGEEILEEANYEQFSQRQALADVGGGLEFLLGDRDDRVKGVFRVYYNLDTAQQDPAETTTVVNSDFVISQPRESARHIGMASVGLDWGVVGNPDSFQAGLSAHIGSGFLTADKTEFFTILVGPTASYRFTRQVSVFADLQYRVRFRKELSNGAGVVLGARYMFD